MECWEGPLPPPHLLGGHAGVSTSVGPQRAGCRNQNHRQRSDSQQLPAGKNPSGRKPRVAVWPPRPGQRRQKHRHGTRDSYRQSKTAVPADISTILHRLQRTFTSNGSSRQFPRWASQGLRLTPTLQVRSWSSQGGHAELRGPQSRQGSSHARPWSF